MEFDKKITKKELGILVDMQKTYKELYNEFDGLCGISNEVVQITNLSFFENFDDKFQIDKRDCKTYPWIAKTNFKGVTFICLLNNDRIFEIKQDLKIDLKDKLPK